MEHNVWLLVFFFFVLIMLYERTATKKRRVQKMLAEKGAINMETKFFEDMLGKDVEIRTMDDYVDGTLVAIDGDVLYVEKHRKTDIDKFYINKSFISMIKIKNKKY